MHDTKRTSYQNKKKPSVDFIVSARLLGKVKFYFSPLYDKFITLTIIFLKEMKRKVQIIEITFIFFKTSDTLLIKSDESP